MKSMQSVFSKMGDMPLWVCFFSSSLAATVRPLIFPLPGGIVEMPNANKD